MSKSKFVEKANEFKRGSTLSLLPLLREEFPEKGPQENNLWTPNEQCSYMLGVIVKQFEQGDQTYGYTEKYLYQDNYKKPYEWAKTLKKKALINGMSSLTKGLQQAFAHICANVSDLGTDIDGKMYVAGLMARKKKRVSVEALKEEAADLLRKEIAASSLRKVGERIGITGQTAKNWCSDIPLDGAIKVLEKLGGRKTEFFL